jgi:hypothetical protein
MKDLVPVSELRARMGDNPKGGTAKPVSPLVAAQTIKKNRSQLEIDFARRWNDLYPFFPPVEQFIFHNQRDWRFDFVWPIEGPKVEKRRSAGGVALEIQGGIWKRSTKGHNGGTGLINSYEKINTAQMCNFVVFQFSDREMNNPKWLEKLAHCVKCVDWYKTNYERFKTK